MLDEAYWKERIDWARKEGDQVRLGEYLSGLGGYYANAGRSSEAIDTLSAAIHQLRKAGRPDFAPMACKNLASVYEMVLHDLPTAAMYIQMAADMAGPNDPDKEMYRKWAVDLREKARKG